MRVLTLDATRRQESIVPTVARYRGDRRLMQAHQEQATSSILSTFDYLTFVEALI
jgi:hypothetical protein